MHTAEIIPFPTRRSIPPPIIIRDGYYAGIKESLIKWGIADADAFPTWPQRQCKRDGYDVWAFGDCLFRVRVFDCHTAAALDVLLLAATQRDPLSVSVSRIIAELHELLFVCVENSSVGARRNEIGCLFDQAEMLVAASIRYAQRCPRSGRRRATPEPILSY